MELTGRRLVSGLVMVVVLGIALTVTTWFVFPEALEAGRARRVLGIIWGLSLLLGAGGVLSQRRRHGW